MKRYIRANRRRGYTFDYAGAGYVRKTLTLYPNSTFDYDYSKGGEAYVLYFTDEDGANYAYYCQNSNSPIFDRIDNGILEPMKISCQVKEPLEYPAGYDDGARPGFASVPPSNWILRPRLLK